MHVLFECAARWELIQANPITRLRQRGSRLAEPDVLTPAEFHAVLNELHEQPARTMVILAGCMSLSRCELIGLRCGDFS